MPRTNPLLTDEERQVLTKLQGNRLISKLLVRTTYGRIVSSPCLLFNAATKQLVLSSPILVNEVDDKMSPYLLELTKEPLALSVIQKKERASSEDMGSYQALLARLIELHQGEIDQELSKEEATFWAVAIRAFGRKFSVRKTLAHTPTKLAKNFDEPKDPTKNETL